MKEDDERMNEPRMFEYNDDVVVVLRNGVGLTHCYPLIRLIFESLLLLETEESSLHQAEVPKAKES